MRRSHVFATAGHVDHGKSALIKALTGIEPDRWDEERRRGMTLDLGFAWTTIDDVDVAFVDVPGHERYVPTMLAGAGPVAGVLFVVAADEGWSAQSTEHLQGLRALGVDDGVLVITKTDLFDPEYAEAEAREHLQAAGLGAIPAVAVSALRGDGLDDLRAEMLRLADRLPRPDPTSDVRLWLDRSFTIAGAGTVVTGTLTNGTLRVGDQLELHGARAVEPVRARIRGLQSAGRDLTEVTGATRVAVNLRGVRPEEASRGSQLITAGSLGAPRAVDARLHLDEAEGPERLPEHCAVHIGTASMQARLRPLGDGHVRVSFGAPLPLRIGDRMVLRDPGRHAVLGAAVVLDVDPPELRRRGAAKARAAALADYPERPDAAVLLRDKGLISADALRRAGCAQIPAPIAGWCLDPDYRTELAERLARLVAQDAVDDPDSRGVSIGEATRRLDLPASDILLNIVDELDGVEVADGHLIGERHAVLSPSAEAALQRFLAEVGDAQFYSPEAPRLRELGLDPATLAVLCRHGELIDLGKGVYLTPTMLEDAVARLAKIDQPFTLSEGRAALGTTRRIAVPLMEHLRRTGRSRRVDGEAHAIVR